MKFNYLGLWAIIFIWCFQSIACKNDSGSNKKAKKSVVEFAEKDSIVPSTPAAPILKFESFDRAVSLKKMKDKIAKNEPLIVHVFVPLCDNDHQGIVPVNARLGNGLNLQTNLYWGAKYGVKSYFKSLKNWKLLHAEKDLNQDVLERVVFFRNYGNGKTIYLVTDAYRGDRMRACLMDYFHGFDGEKKGSVRVKNEVISIYDKADLLVFNGHNGLMDTTIDPFNNQDGVMKDAAVIACISGDYFIERLNYLKAYPILTTTNLLAPEAYVLESVVDNWAKLEDGQAFKTGAGKAYHRFQNCGVKGATRLFKTGW